VTWILRSIKLGVFPWEARSRIVILESLRHDVIDGKGEISLRETDRSGGIGCVHTITKVAVQLTEEKSILSSVHFHYCCCTMSKWEKYWDKRINFRFHHGNKMLWVCISWYTIDGKFEVHGFYTRVIFSAMRNGQVCEILFFHAVRELVR